MEECPQTIDQYNKDLEASDAEIDKGNFITHEQLKKEVESWLNTAQK